MYIALVQSWSILAYSGYISLGVTTFFGIGAYTMGQLWNAIPLALIPILGGAIALLIALVVSFPLLRVSGAYFTILTYGLTLLIQSIILVFETRYSQVGTAKIIVLGYMTDIVYYAMVAVGVSAVIVNQLVIRSKLGKALYAIRENEEAAESLGIDTYKYKLIAFLLSSLYAGITGSLMAIQIAWIDPYTAFQPIVSFQTVVIGLLGGMGGPLGLLLASILFSVIQQILWTSYPFHHSLLLGVIFLLVVSYRFGLLSSIRLLSVLKERLTPTFRSWWVSRVVGWFKGL
jgi:branched-chain amino acid transport system permease protein